MASLAHIRMTIHDVPQLMAALEAAAEVVRVAYARGFVSGDSRDIAALHRALDCVGPRVQHDGPTGQNDLNGIEGGGKSGGKAPSVTARGG